jgi:hypothetical protein
MRIYLSPDDDGNTGGGAETITIGGVEYDADETITIGDNEFTFGEIQQWADKNGELTTKQEELEKAASLIKPFLKLLNEDPDAAAVEMQRLLDDARKTAKKSGESGDNELVKKLESQQDQIAKMMLDSTIKDMKSDSENYPYFKGNEDEVLKYCAEHNIDELETGYNAWVGKNLKKLTSNSERADRNAGATTLGRGGRSSSTKDAEWKPGEGWSNYLNRTGQMPKS